MPRISKNKTYIVLVKPGIATGVSPWPIKSDNIKWCSRLTSALLPRLTRRIFG